MSRVLIGSTVPAFKMSDRWDGWRWWLERADEISAAAAAEGHEVDWLAVLQTDGRGLAPFAPLLNDLYGILDGEKTHWSFSIDTGEQSVSSDSRLIAICTGRNLIIEHANRHGHDFIYFADSDIEAPPETLPRLLELDWPVCGAHVPTYCLDGPAATSAHYLAYNRSTAIRRAGRKGDVRIHWNTAGSLLVRRDVFLRVPWRWDHGAELTDDPATQGEMARLGWPTLVRHDVLCAHHPESIGPLEVREHDLTVYR